MQLLLIIIVLTLDQGIKFLISSTGFPLTPNYGISFGLLPNSFVTNPLFILIIIIALTLLHLKEEKDTIERNKLNIVSFSLLISGAFSNLLDKIIFGFIRDFIDIKIIPVFNIADIAITIAIILYVVRFVKSKNNI